MKMHWSVLSMTTFFALLFAGALSAQDTTPADSTGLPGDNFSLEAALEMFKKSESLEGFEKMLNTEDNDANNLDLNEDGKTDYVRVIDRTEGDVHAIVLQVPVSAAEAQDIAVIEIEKDGTESATLQIVGDEDIYGQEVIAEPFQEDAVKSSGQHGPALHMAPVFIVVNVWGWPSVRYIYRPAYVAYVSPWAWGLYPTYWRPFRPRPWGFYHARVRPYRVHYRVVPTHRVVRAHTVYSGHRTHSTVVHTRTVTHVNKYGRNNLQSSKTTKTTSVQDNRGRSASQKQTTVEGRRGSSVTREKTTVEGRNGRSATKKETTVEGRRGNSVTKEKTTRQGNRGKSAPQKAQGGGRRGRH